MPLTHVDRGRYGETLAAAFLELRGYTVIERNLRFGRLEIDLVARRHNLVAFVEVKYRRNSRGGGAGAAVGFAKQRDVETAAVGYLQRRGWKRVAVRFDVVTVETPHPEENALVLRHLEAAFPASGRYRW